MTPMKLHHVALHTKNIEKSIAFYTDVGGVV